MVWVRVHDCWNTANWLHNRRRICCTCIFAWLCSYSCGLVVKCNGVSCWHRVHEFAGTSPWLEAKLPTSVSSVHHHLKSSQAWARCKNCVQLSLSAVPLICSAFDDCTNAEFPYAWHTKELMWYIGRVMRNMTTLRSLPGGSSGLFQRLTSLQELWVCIGPLFACNKFASYGVHVLNKISLVA